MKFVFFIILLGGTAFAQSGRVKPAETPQPQPRATPNRAGNYTPTNDRPRKLSPEEIRDAQKASDDEVISIESALVPIPVSLIGSDGRPIRNLVKEDLTLTVDGEPAEISELFTSDTPVRLALLFDNSSSVMVAREFEKDAAIRFFKRVLRPDKDLAALFSVATATRLEQTFTGDVSRLVRSIELFPPPAGATALLDGIIQAANYLEDTTGRRVIVIVSDGDDTVSDSTFEKTIKTLQTTNCQVFVVKTTDFENFIRTGSRTGSANTRQLSAERRMKEIAEQTGGAVYSPIDRTELDGAFRQISAELSQQYIISYYPEPDPARSGTFRTFDLKYKRPDKVMIRFRKGYYIR